MVIEAHPSYPRPTVQEAICEIVVQPSSSGFTMTKPGPIFKALMSKYPELETPPIPAFFHPGGIVQAGVMAASPFIRLANAETGRHIFVGDSFIRLHQLGRYPGWPALQDEVISIWQTFEDLAKPTGLARVSVRYLNLIERSAELPSPSDWLSASESISKLALNSVGNRPFVSRTESWLSETDLMIVSVGQRNPIGDELPPIILDIEYSARATEAMNPDKIRGELDRLHEGIWIQFQAAKSSQLEDRLNMDSES